MIIKEKMKKSVHNAYDVAKIMHSILQAEDEIDQEKEHFWVLGLSTNYSIKYIELSSLGILDSNVVHPREVYRLAIMKAVKAIVVVHNHPSNNMTPSIQDKDMTKRLKQAGEVLGISLLDHIIIGSEPECFYSFATEHTDNIF